MRAPRITSPVVALVCALVPAVAFARVAPPIHVRWTGGIPGPARAATEFSGRLELQMGASAVVDDLRLEGRGWSVRSLDAPPRMSLARGDRRAMTFRATPADPAEPLVVRGSVDGQPFRETFRFDEASVTGALARGNVRRQAPPRLSGAGSSAQLGGQVIRFTGRFMYMRDDNSLVGGDQIIVRIMDDDSPAPDEEIWSGPTDTQGNFDVTVNWDDCDAFGCDDPDIYVVYETANGVVDVQADDLLETTYSWSSEDQTIEDFTGSQVDFGVDQPGNNVGAAHIYTNIIRGYRAVYLDGGMEPPQVNCEWPSPDATNYSFAAQEIQIESDETWTEATHVHEFGHHVHYSYGTPEPSQYSNGYCDTPTPGHCVWCPENLIDGWKEGWTDWLGSYVIRGYPSLYGITARSINDSRYMLEFSNKCSQDTTVDFPDAAVEGYVGMLLRDIEDASNDDHDGGAADCAIDAMSLGADEIFNVIRQDDPEDVIAFVTSFRQRYPQYDQDLWSTTQNVGSVFSFSKPYPVITVQPGTACRNLNAGEFLALNVDASGSLLQYRWRKDGVALTNAGGYAGTGTKQLMMGPVTASFAGTYDCEVRTCDSAFAALSSAVSISVFAPPAPRNLISWGENQGAECGGGPPPTITKPPGNHTGLSDVVQVDGGRQYFLGLKANGTVVSWGSQGSGALGRPGVTTYALPGAIAGLSNNIQIAAGYYHGLALDRDGVVRGWGYNLYGQLGDGTGTDRSTPVVATAFPSCVKAIAAGEEFTVVLSGDGTVWTVGRNSSGQLGRTTPLGYSRTPAPVPGLSGVVAIATNLRRAFAIKSDGTVWGWGQGNLGNGSIADSPVPVQVSGITNARSVASGYYNSYVIRNDGQVWGWGSALSLGNGGSGAEVTTPVQVPQLANAIKIEGADNNHAMALIGDGTVRVWGTNGANIFNNAAVTSSSVPIAVPGITNVTGFTVGYNTAVAIGGDGTVDVEPVPAMITAIELSIEPNPSRATAQIRFSLPQAGPVSLGVFDVAGRQVQTLLSEPRPAGRHVVTWSDDAHRQPGVFFIRLRANGQSITRMVTRVN